MSLVFSSFQMDLDTDDSCNPSPMDVVQVINSTPPLPNCSAALYYKSPSFCVASALPICFLCIIPVKFSLSLSIPSSPARCCSAHTPSDMMCVDSLRDVCVAPGYDPFQ